MEKQGLDGTMSIADCIPYKREHYEGSVEDTDSGLLCLPLESYCNAPSSRPDLCKFRGLVLSQGEGQPRGHYRRWGVLEEQYSTFFENSNEASGEWYVDRENGIIMII